MKRLLLILSLLLVPFFGTGQPIEKACFSVPGGFYEESPTLEIFPVFQQHHIRFTTNGNRPTAASRLYTGPLLLDGRLYSTSDIYTIQISPDTLVYVPDSVQHCIVIRAAVFDENDSCISPVTTNSYFILSLGCDTHGLPAVSLCADSLDLFDYENGIFVPGAAFNPLNPDHTGNYYMHGREWEREANVEFREYNTNDGLNQVCGLRTHGNLSRRYPSKGMKIYAREDYGTSRFNYNFYNDSIVDSYKHLVLKPFALGWPNSGIQDYLSEKLALQAGLPSSDNRPVILYLNGEYWGIYFLQEKMDERFLENHFGTNVNNCSIIGDWHGNVECGNNIGFMQMLGWLNTANLDNEANYRHICDLIDMDNYVNYMVYETFIANWDWPFNNMRCWQEGEGKWKWMFFDGDAALLTHDFDVFANASVYNPPSSWNNYPEAKLLFGKLLKNEQFVAAFEARATELCSSVFLYENTYPMYQGIVEALRPNVESHSYRHGIPASVSDWEYGITFTKGFLNHRIRTFWEEWYAFNDLEEGYEAQMSILPNPSSDEIHLQLSDALTCDAEIAIYDVLGRKVFAGTGSSGTQEITLNPELPAGVYFLKINNSVAKIIRK